MLIEHSKPNSTRMESLPDNTLIRIWFDVNRFITIQPVNDGTAVMIRSHNAPGGHSYGAPVRLESDGSNSIVIK